MEPPEIYEGTSYFYAIFKTATELKLVENKDGIISLVDSNKQLNNIDEFRKHVITVLPEFEESQFWKCSNIIVNLNERVYEYGAISDSNMLNLLSERTGETIKAPMIRGWRFWSQFLGFGCMNGFTFFQQERFSLLVERQKVIILPFKDWKHMQFGAARSILLLHPLNTKLFWKQ